MNSKSKPERLEGSIKIEFNQKGLPKPINNSLPKKPTKTLKKAKKTNGKKHPKTWFMNFFVIRLKTVWFG